VKRRKPLRSRKVIRAARKRSKYRSRERHVDYMLGVKQLPCAAMSVPGHACDGPIEADHAGPRSTGRKAHDSTVIPLCRQGHRERTDFAGPFRSWNQATMRDWLLGRIPVTQRLMRERGFEIPEGATYRESDAPTVTPDCTCASNITTCARHLFAEVASATPSPVFPGAPFTFLGPDGTVVTLAGESPLEYTSMTVTIAGRSEDFEIIEDTAELARRINERFSLPRKQAEQPRDINLVEGLREDGNLDVRYPDAARVVSEGDQS
jgi:hypothetical protein